MTLGGAGHALALLEASPSAEVLGIDRDQPAILRSQKRLSAFSSRAHFFHGSFLDLEAALQSISWKEVDGVFTDLGVSSFQLDEAERGFSFRNDAPLDMRMNIKAHLTAAKVVNEYSVDKLSVIFKEYGDFQMARKLAFEIDKARVVRPLRTTGDLKSIVEPLFPAKAQTKFLARLFQSIRMEVNQEVETLKTLLHDGTSLLKPGGRFAIITYHSIEDRLVKNFFRSGNFEGKLTRDFYGNVEAPLKPVGKMIIPDEKEIEINPRSRSAKLRIAEKL